MVGTPLINQVNLREASPEGNETNNQVDFNTLWLVSRCRSWLAKLLTRLKYSFKISELTDGDWWCSNSRSLAWENFWGLDGWSSPNVNPIRKSSKWLLEDKDHKSSSALKKRKIVPSTYSDNESEDNDLSSTQFLKIIKVEGSKSQEAWLEYRSPQAYLQLSIDHTSPKSIR